jgi:Methyltransferase domain
MERSTRIPIRQLAGKVRRRLSRWTRRQAAADPGQAIAAVVPQAAPEPPPIDPLVEKASEYLKGLILARHSDDSNRHMHNDFNHMRRFVTSLTWIPDNAGRILDPAAGGGAMFPDMLRHFKGAEVETPPYYNLEKEPAPYPDATFDGVVLMEVLEHFTVDPMYALCELSRVIKPGGFLFLTTPNIASWLALNNLIKWHSPYLYGVFERKPNPDRHNREYTVVEVERLARAAGFETERLEALNAYDNAANIPPIPGIDPYNRGETTFLLARKVGPVVDRYPDWLYTNWGD